MRSGALRLESQGRVRLESPANQAIVALSLLSAGASINSATLTSCSTSSTAEITPIGFNPYDPTL